jgi:methylamine dehydrogenase heavy chain
VLKSDKQISLVLFLVGSIHQLVHAEVESTSIMQLKTDNPDRVFLQDIAISHMVDSRMLIVDGKTMKLEGMISTGLMGNSVVSPDRNTIYAGTTYYSKLNRGERVDMLEVIDMKTLTRRAEIIIPTKRTESIPYVSLLTMSAQGRYVYIQNTTPAVSVTVFDAKSNQVLSEIPTPGCYSIVPALSEDRRFSTLCGDGTLLTITLDDQGKSLSQQRSAVFFDPDKDPIFITPAHDNIHYYFTSYLGKILQINANEAKAELVGTWNLLNRVEQQMRWRPSGYHQTAIDVGNKKLYVAMRPKGFDGSHKMPATEIWELDLGTHKRLRKIPGHGAVAISVSAQGAEPSLYALNGEDGSLIRLSLGKQLKVLAKSQPALVESPFVVRAN